MQQTIQYLCTGALLLALMLPGGRGLSAEDLPRYKEAVQLFQQGK